MAGDMEQETQNRKPLRPLMLCEEVSSKNCPIRVQELRYGIGDICLVLRHRGLKIKVG